MCFISNKQGCLFRNKNISVRYIGLTGFIEKNGCFSIRFRRCQVLRTLTGRRFPQPVSVVRPDRVYLPAAWFYQNEFHSRLV